jgi:hypothetical protein
LKFAFACPQPVTEIVHGQFVDFTKSKDIAADVHAVSKGGAHGAVVAGGTPAAYKVLLSGDVEEPRLTAAPQDVPYYLRKAGVMVCV